jgi:four helix bundle protein
MKYQELLAYKKSIELAMSIFEVSKSFPKEETYALTDQIRRSSRSVSANISEAYRKRRYEKHFLSKLSDSDAENAETQTWLEYALACNYLDREIYNLHLRKSIEVGNLIGYMMRNPAKFIYGE